MKTKKWYYVSCREDAAIIYDCRENIKTFYEGGQWTTVAGGYDTKEELIKECKILPDPCKECGKPIYANYVEPVYSEMVKSNLCFTCNFWTEKIKELSDPRKFVINGEVYHRQDDSPNNRFQGFGGRHFKIQRNNGEVIETNNLWSNGQIPTRFLNRIKNNAIFVK